MLSVHQFFGNVNKIASKSLLLQREFSHGVTANSLYLLEKEYSFEMEIIKLFFKLTALFKGHILREEKYLYYIHVPSYT